MTADAPVVRAGVRPSMPRLITGWTMVVIVTAMAGLWGFWGAAENFHEGWYHASLWRNLAMMFAQYLMVALVFMMAGLAAVHAPRVGALVFVGMAAFSAWFFRGASFAVLGVLIVLPLVGLGALSWWGRPHPRRAASWVIAGVTLASILVTGAVPAWRVATRIDDGDRGARTVTANGTSLTWAPEGPGWPLDGVSYEEAVRRCRYLRADGLSLADEPQDVWRLPTAHEVVAASARNGQNCGGTWDGRPGRAVFPACSPDKEPPLWNPRSKVIYWWTTTPGPDDRRFRVSYNGHVMPLPPATRWGYLGFRAVKPAEP